MFPNIKTYVSLQHEVIDGILKVLGKSSLLYVEEDDLWEFEGKLEGEWQIMPHGEHLHCISSNGSEIEIPLYVQSCVGVDIGHFIQYLDSVSITHGGYNAIAQEFEKLENVGKMSVVVVKSMSPLWRLSN